MNYRQKTPTIQAVKFTRTPEQINKVRDLVSPYVIQDDYDCLKVCGYSQDGSIDNFHPIKILNENDWIIKRVCEFDSSPFNVLSDEEFQYLYETVL